MYNKSVYSQSTARKDRLNISATTAAEVSHCFMGVGLCAQHLTKLHVTSA